MDTKKNQPNKTKILSIETKEDKVALQKKVQWIIGLLRIKLIALGVSDTVLHDSKSTMFDSYDGTHYTFRVGSHFKFSLPAEFIEQTEKTTNRELDFLIQDWSFFLNGEEIPLSVWSETMVIDTLIKDSAARVAESVSMQWKTAEEIDLINKKITSETEWLRWSLKRLVDKLLPPRTGQNTVTRHQLPKIWKYPIFSVVPRLKNNK